MTFAVFLVVADRKLRVEEDPRLEGVMDALPMTNCGACGAAGCHGFAELLLAGKMEVNACVPGGQDVADALAELLGVESVAATRDVAVVLCRGGDAETTLAASYRGERSCIASDLTGGEKACTYACLGYGDCVDSCKFDAMAMNSNGLPVVFYDKCVGCEACAKTCPRDIIEMHPKEHTLFVYCRNKDKGGPAKKACKVACISCGLCKKDSEVEGAIEIIDSLAVISYELCPQDDKTTGRCPTKCILFGEEEGITSAAFYSGLLKNSTAPKDSKLKKTG